MDQEWAVDVADVLWRRSKLGLHVSDDTKDGIATWMAAAALKEPSAPAEAVKTA